MKIDNNFRPLISISIKRKYEKEFYHCNYCQLIIDSIRFSEDLYSFDLNRNKFYEELNKLSNNIKTYTDYLSENNTFLSNDYVKEFKNNLSKILPGNFIENTNYNFLVNNDFLTQMISMDKSEKIEVGKTYTSINENEILNFNNRNYKNFYILHCTNQEFNFYYQKINEEEFTIVLVKNSKVEFEEETERVYSGKMFINSFKNYNFILSYGTIYNFEDYKNKIICHKGKNIDKIGSFYSNVYPRNGNLLLMPNFLMYNIKDYDNCKFIINYFNRLFKIFLNYFYNYDTIYGILHMLNSADYHQIDKKLMDILVKNNKKLFEERLIILKKIVSYDNYHQLFKYCKKNNRIDLIYKFYKHFEDN